MDRSADGRFSANVVLAGGHVQDYGSLSIIKIPGEPLSDSQRAAVLAKLQQEQPPPSLNFQVLSSKLLDLQSATTPPPDNESRIDRARSLERQAREDLEKEGYRPYYPADLAFPIRYPPPDYREIISYWKSLPATGEVILRAQLSDWFRFRQFQESNRQYYRRHKTKWFGDFLHAVRQRRRRHRLGEDIRLRPNPAQQSPLENWVEFQDYHLHRHEQMEQNIQEAREAFDKARQESETAGSATSQRAKEDVDIHKGKLESVERQLRQHDVLLWWIEQQRTRIQAEQETVPETDVVDRRDEEHQVFNVIRKATVIERKRVSKRKPRSVLSPSRVKKPEAEATKRNTQYQKRNVSVVLGVPEAGPTDEDFGPSQSRTSRSQGSNARDRKPQLVKQIKSLGPFRPKKVSKDNHCNAKIMSPKARNRAGFEKQLLSMNSLKTRSGRISRPPKKWIPDK